MDALMSGWVNFEKKKQNTIIKDFELGIFENDTARVEML